MCGICGILDLDGKEISSDMLHKMNDLISHRGPDSEGFYINKFIGLGHRRLAIIDLSSAGNQPMISQDKRYVISFNGEIYNFKELRLELEQLGYKFISKTDTEVVLYAYDKWGKDALLRFNGMFALAIWDNKKAELFIARDRYGIKPLYYTFINGVFLIASEIKAFLGYRSFLVEINKEALVQYMTFQNFLNDDTIFKNVKILKPATFLQVRKGQKKISQPTQYWDFNFETKYFTKDEKEYEKEFNRLFNQAIERQLVSDVPVGSYLSGGIDSGSITAIASQKIDNFKTFTVGFDINKINESHFDEREKAEYLSSLYNTQHYEMVLKEKDMQRIMPTLSWHIEEPRVSYSYPNFFAAHLASKFVKVVLSGTGGDELFGGYPWRYTSAITSQDRLSFINKYYCFWQRIIPSNLLQDVLEPIWKDVKHVNTLDIFSNIFEGNLNSNNPSTEDLINASLYFEAKTFLHALLTIEDKISMAHSLETRVPFLDNDLVDFAQALPTNLKIKNIKKIFNLCNHNDPNLIKEYFSQSKDGKFFLRQCSKKYIPKFIVNAKKQGFCPPKNWARNDKSTYIRTTLFNKHAKIYNFLNVKTISHMLNQHFQEKKDHNLLIWSLMNLECWCNQYLK
jgi:asparagine synthase (glutamine-hydrolysing)